MISVWTENITSVVGYTILLYGNWNCQTVKLSTQNYVTFSCMFKITDDGEGKNLQS